MVSPFGGDGGDTLVDHTNGNRAVVEYVGLDMALTTNGGAVGRHARLQRLPRDLTVVLRLHVHAEPVRPARTVHRAVRARPREPEPSGSPAAEYVWDQRSGRSRKGWDTTCGVVLVRLADPSATAAPGHSITQVAMSERHVVRGVVRPVQLGRLHPRHPDELRRHGAPAEPCPAGLPEPVHPGPRRREEPPEPRLRGLQRLLPALDEHVLRRRGPCLRDDGRWRDLDRHQREPAGRSGRRSRPDAERAPRGRERHRRLLLAELARGDLVPLRDRASDGARRTTCS